MGHEGPVTALAVVETPDGPMIASGSDDGTIRLWDGRTGAPGPVLEGHEGVVTALAVVETPDGPKIASGSSDRTIRLWDPVLGSLAAHFVFDVAVSSLSQAGRSRIAVGCTDGGVHMMTIRP